MSKIIIVAVIVVVLLAALTGWGTYNSFVTLDETINNAWAQVETVLQRRYDLIPNLVNSVKGYAQHEKSTFEEIARLRSQWGEARGTEAKVQTANQLEGALSKLLLVAENYPELKANENFRALQDELAGTENRISVERRRYNDTIREYNVAVRKFPASVFAGFFGFTKKDAYFESAEGAEKAPQVQF